MGMRFHAAVELNGKTATGIEVPADVVEALGTSRRPAVKVTLAGYTYRTTVAARGDRFLVPVSAEVRAAAGVEAGDELEVEIELDTEPRDVTVPADLAEALAPHPEARRFLDGLSPSRKKAYVTWIEEAKKPETRASRVEKAAAALRAGRVQR